ncbi:hypothetical protein LNO75_02735 [Mycoplasma sp. T363T]|uniref:hypothetical protein n=1 Tax=Mycoplasma bradburyae TaxID=2963128 RepID=UPI00234158A1|nr:hypothetical protein [Mycoplasma bradburyae]MDC4163491.1 hypothetical protein [Mycoplasma bradburyae]
MKNKKSILKIITLLGVGSIVALSTASCAGVKLSETKLSLISPNQPSEPNPSNPEPTKSTMNGESNPSLVAIRDELNNLIRSENQNISLYDDYSLIKQKLQNAYNSAKSIDGNSESSIDDLKKAIADLQKAITDSTLAKTSFDTDNMQLLSAYNALKITIKNKETNDLSYINNPKYIAIKNELDLLYQSAQNIISKTLQSSDLTKDIIENSKNSIESFISTIQNKKDNIDNYSSFKKFVITSTGFHGDFAKNREQALNNKLVGFSSNLGTFDYRFARRNIENVSNSNELTDVSWIYSLDTATGDNKEKAKYSLQFEYYGGSSATLYIPYKSFLTSQNNNNIGLQYRLNNSDDWIDITNLVNNATIDDVKVLEFDLTNLKFGNNTIDFSVPEQKTIPALGNFYLTLPKTEESKNKIYNDIFGNEVNSSNPNEIKINFSKGYGLANKSITRIYKINAAINGNGQAEDNYVLGYLGGSDNTNDNTVTSIRYYTFYVNAPSEGLYEISGIYNSGESRKLVFWTKQFNNTDADGKAQFKDLMSGDWNNSLKSFNSMNKDQDSKSTLKLIQGLNKIIVSGEINNMNNSPAPNLGNVTFTLSTPMNSSK